MQRVCTLEYYYNIRRIQVMIVSFTLFNQIFVIGKQFNKRNTSTDQWRQGIWGYVLVNKNFLLCMWVINSPFF